MKDLVVFMATNLVDNPDQIKVVQRGGSHSTVIELTVATEDMGRVIGKSGRVANAMRAVVNVAAARQGKQVILDIVDPEEGRSR